MVDRLHEISAANHAERLRDSVVRWIEDPMKPKTTAGKLRINPILLLLALLAVIAMGTFLFFSLVAP